MLKMFIKRWQNMKIAVPFCTWADIVKAKREARRLAALEQELCRLSDQMKMMADSEMMQRLKLHFAMLTGRTQQMTFNALRKHCDMAKIAKLADDERFKRLKTVLQMKLKGVKFAVWHALKR